MTFSPPVTLRAKWILPVEGAPIEGGYVAIAGGRIAAIATTNPDLSPVDDLGDSILMPGLVNAHTHLEFSALERPLGAPGMTLPEWIRLVIGERKRGDSDAGAAIRAGLAESVAAGVTSIGEIATASASDYATAKPQAELMLFQEAIGFSAGRVESVAGDVERRLDAAAGLRAGISPHAPYTVHPLLLERLVRLAVDRRLPVAMHLAESREELQLLRDGDGPFRELLEERSMWDGSAIPRGSRPLDYLRALVEAPRALVVHGNYFDQEEIEFLGQRRERMSIAFCPRTHGYFRHEAYPLEAMLDAGVRVALGTDSRASNPDLDLLAEVRFAARRFPGVSPERWVRMATLDGAEALGLDKELGSLAPGKRTDLIAVACSGDCRDPVEHVIGGDGLAAGANRLVRGPLPGRP